MNDLSRRAGLIVGLVVALIGCVTLFDHTLVGVFYDDGLYAGLARALGTGHGYVHLHMPGAPAAVHYPPLYPVLLAPFFGLFSLDAAALAGKVLNIVLAGGTAGLVAWHATRIKLLGEEAPVWLAPAVVAAAAVAVPVLATQSVLFSEPLFAVLFAGAIVAADQDPPRPWLAGSLAALALLTRSIAIAAAAGIVAYLTLMRRTPRADAPHGRTPRADALRVVAPVAVAAAAWAVWVTTHRHGIDPALGLNYGSYNDVMTQAGLGALGSSLSDLPRPLGVMTLSWLGVPILYKVLGFAALTVGLYGLVVLARRSSAGWSLIGYLAILAVWPYPGDRFLWAVLPWIALAWSAAVVELVQVRQLRAAAAIVAATVVIGYGIYEFRGYSGRWWGTVARGISANFRELLPAVAELPADAVVASDDEALVWLYTGRRAVPFYIWTLKGRESVEPSAAEHRAYLERQGVTHVLFTGPGSGSDHELERLQSAYPGWLTIVRRWPASEGRALFQVRIAHSVVP